jgi:hypothetical protein
VGRYTDIVGRYTRADGVTHGFLLRQGIKTDDTRTLKFCRSLYSDRLCLTLGVLAVRTILLVCGRVNASSLVDQHRSLPTERLNEGAAR